MFNFDKFLLINRKKAQKCYCGSQNCRGVIGGENANILTDGSKIPRKGSREEVESESNSESEFDNIQDVRVILCVYC